MGLIEKLRQTEFPSISAHAFNGIVMGWLLNDFNDTAAQQALETLLGQPLAAGELTKLLEFKTHFLTLTPNQQSVYLQRLEGYTILLQKNLLTEAQYKTLMGIT